MIAIAISTVGNLGIYHPTVFKPRTHMACVSSLQRKGLTEKLRHGGKGRGGEKVVGEIADRAIIPGLKSVDERQLGE